MYKNILITGARGEFGKLSTLHLLENGHTVVASMRDTKGEIAKTLKDAGAYIVVLDVTDDTSVDNGVKTAVDLVGDIDVVINNAGIGAFGLQETFTPQDWQKIFDINLFGVQRVNRAVLPYMRDKNNGLLIHISSLIGRMILPFWGPYSASKWALEALAENYRVELSAFGIESCIIEPGAHPTAFFDSLIMSSDKMKEQSYGNFSKVPMKFYTNFEKALASNQAQNPQNVADAIATLIDIPKGERPFRTIVDKMGMGKHIQGYNNLQEQITSTVYSAFGIEDMLKLKI